MHLNGRLALEGADARLPGDCGMPGLEVRAGRFAARHEDEGAALLIDGTVHGLEPVRMLRDPALLDDAYGYFAYLHVDKRSKRMRLGTDRLGFFPLYRATTGGTLHFGTSLDALRAGLPACTPDFDAWEETLVLGEVLGDKTPLKGVERLPPGTGLEIADGRVRETRRWQPTVPEPVDERSYVERNNALLLEALALAGREPGRHVVPLSGGEDSRRLAIGTVKAGLPVEFWTQAAMHRDIGDNDSPIAKLVAGRLGRPWTAVAMASAEDYLADLRAERCCLGFESDGHAWLYPLVRALPPGSIVYDGIVGDVTINGHYFKKHPGAPADYRDVGKLADQIIPATHADWLATLRAHTSGGLRERLCALLESYPDSPHRITFYYLLNHTRRRISLVSQMMVRFGHRICYPYLYAPLFDQSLSAPVARQVEVWHHRLCMDAMAPELADLPSTRGGVPPELITPMGEEARRRTEFVRRRETVREEVFALFPTLKRRYGLLRAMGPLRPLATRRNSDWFLAPLARYSAFLDWIDGRAPCEPAPEPRPRAELPRTA